LSGDAGPSCAAATLTVLIAGNSFPAGACP
jgi:hypothetical protein